MEVMQAILGRHSVRAFRSTPLEREVLDKLMDAAAMAPSALNSQPWRFQIASGQTRRQLGEVIAQTTRHLAEYVDLLGPEELKKAEAFYADLGGAPVVIGLTLPEVTDEIDAVNEYLAGGCALENLLLAAVDEGLGACNLTVPIWVRDELMELLEVPEGRVLASLIVVGYPAEEPVAPEHRHDIATILE